VSRGDAIDATDAAADPGVAGWRGGGLINPAMVGVATGATLVPLNSTMLAVALPSIATAFAITPSEVASLVTLYLGAVAVTLPMSGSIGDRFGHRRSFVAGVIGFGGASLVAALAPSFAVLVVSRLLQAASGSLVSTASVALIRDLSPVDRRGAAFGIFDMLVSTSAAVAPLLGGLIVAAFGWRAMFFLAAPIAIVAVVTVGLRPAGRAEPTASQGNPAADDPPARVGAARSRSIDAPGLALLALVLIAFLVALRGGDSAPIAAIASVLLLVAFVVVEGRSTDPAVDPGLFRSRSFSAAVLGVAGATVVLHATLVLVPLLIERLDEGDAAASGVALLGISTMWAVAAPFGGRWSDHAGRRAPVVAGSAIMLVGLGILWQVAGTASVLVVGLLLAVVGLGMGLSGSPRQVAALETVGSNRVGMAASTYYTCRYLGGVVGASLAGAVLGARVTAGGVAGGFGALTVVAVLLVISSFGLAGRRSALSGAS
jgi:DHA2 family methylenomycin A resistance protein-like MFS transporter